MIYFREVQRFRQPWYWAIQIPALAALAYILFRQLVLGKPVRNHPASNTSLAIIALTLALFVVWFIKLELITEVRDHELAALALQPAAAETDRDRGRGAGAEHEQFARRRLGRSLGSRRNGL
jgi:hypothetical protein